MPKTFWLEARFCKTLPKKLFVEKEYNLKGLPLNKIYLDLYMLYVFKKVIHT